MSRYESTKRVESSDFVRAYRYEKYETPLGVVLSSAPSDRTSTGQERTEFSATPKRGGVRGCPGWQRQHLSRKGPWPWPQQIKSLNSLIFFMGEKIGTLLWSLRWRSFAQLRLPHFIRQKGTGHGR